MTIPEPKFSNETIVDLYRLYDALGRAPSVGALAYACRCSKSRAYGALIRAGVQLRPRGERRGILH